MTFLSLPDGLYTIVGVVGFCTYVLAYSLLTLGALTSDSVSYFALNLLAASLVLFSLIGAFNLASLMIQVFWIAISIVAIIKRVKTRRTPEVSFRALQAATKGQRTSNPSSAAV